MKNSLFHNEIERKFLPSLKHPLPPLKNGTEIFQFYFPPEKLQINNNQLFYLQTKNHLLTLTDQEVTLVQTLLSWPKPPKPRIRIMESGQKVTAVLTIKADTQFGQLDSNNQLIPITSSSLATELETSIDQQSPPIFSSNHIEFERPIDTKIASQLLYRIGGQTHQVIAKVRYCISSAFSHPFEIDIFKGPNDFIGKDPKIADNQGLILIELETTKDEIIDLQLFPAWIGQEVTTDIRYANTRLSKEPYADWIISKVQPPQNSKILTKSKKPLQ